MRTRRTITPFAADRSPCVTARPHRSKTGRHYEGDGAIIYKHACRFGSEGIVSKRLGSPYRSGQVDHWLKIKNPAAPAVQRETEEDRGPKRWARGAAYLK